MQNKIQVEIRKVYGNDLIYPICEQGKLFASLLGVKSFNQFQIATMKKLGYSFEVVQQALTV